MMKDWIVLLLVVLFSAGCTSMRIEDFAGTTPELILEEYFSGRLTAYGVLKDRGGRITSSFRAEFVGHWDADGVGTLEEVFVYDDGSTQERVWTFRPRGENLYTGTAPDIVGQADM
ncbi:MAG: DUF3833 family protein, partial [Kiritimatiellia bacterium]